MEEEGASKGTQTKDSWAETVGGMAVAVEETGSGRAMVKKSGQR